MSIGASQSHFRLLIALAVGLSCVVTLAIGLTIWWLRSEAINEASTNAGNLATVLAEQTSRSVQSIDLMFDRVQEEIDALGVKIQNDFRPLLQGEDTHKLLTELMSRLSDIASIALVDNRGMVVNSTIRWPMPPTDLSDREPIQHLIDNNDHGLAVSVPVKERFTNLPTIFFVKRINDRDNEFLGIITIGVRLSRFQHIYESIKSLRGMGFLFLRTDGTVIVRYPDTKDRAGKRMPAGSPWYRLVSQGGGNYRSPGYFDSEARHVAVRSVRDYPLVVNVAISETAALATWRIQAIIIGIGTALVTLCSLFLFKALSKQFHQIETSTAALIQNHHDLERANMKVDATLQNISQGVCMFDAAQRLIVCNKRYADLYELNDEQTKPGTTLRTILEHRIARGNAPDDHQSYINDRIGEVSANKPYQVTNRLKDGRFISVVHRPLADGGWVATHEDVTDWTHAEQRIARMAHFDALTDLPNRTTLNDTMNATLCRAALRGEQFAILSLDLDRFKEANDTYGHLVGDALLREVAHRLQSAAAGTFLARIGGDEFMAIVTDGAQPAAASALAERLLACFVKDFEVEGRLLKIGLSIGGAVYPTDGADAKTLMTNADAALYRAKAESRGTVLFYEPEIGVRLRERHSLQKDLRFAIDRGEFLLHYQPQKKMSGETIGFEALVRWQCPKRGTVAPSTFIPIAEESRLIIPIGEWILREACREAASWPRPLTIAVNVSPIQFHQSDLSRLVHSVLLETGLAPGRLELEITEGVFINDFSHAISILNRLKSLGVKIAMDDFGTGYSSLSYLHSFSCDKIKIDCVFISDLEHNHHSRAIVRAVIGLGHSLNLPILAEGVETEAQHALLVQEGCDEVQGYLTGPPLTISDYADLVGRRPAAQQKYAIAG
jgi:diguanylate cyclase (GGDEF)-like protein